MSIFEYVMLLVSVILSLGIARVLEGHAHLLKAGKLVRWSPTYLAWLFVILMLHVDMWASLWSLHDQASWSWPAIAAVTVSAASIFYAAVLATPDTPAGEPVDLWDFHVRNRRRYVGAILVYGVVGAVMNSLVLPAGQFSLANLTAVLPNILLLLLAIFVRNRWVQIAVPLAILVLMAVYFATFLPEITAA